MKAELPHPKMNKKPWTSEEDDLLLCLVENKGCNWKWYVRTSIERVTINFDNNFLKGQKYQRN